MVAVGADVTAGLASILLTVAVARTQTANSLGVFAITLAIQGLVIGLVRSFTGDVYLFSPGTYRPQSARSMLVGSTSAVLILGLITSLLTLLGALAAQVIFESSLTQAVLMGVALLLIPTSLQQQLRLALVAGRRYVAALSMDIVALVVVICGALFVTHMRPTVMGYLTVWAVASLAHAVGSSLLVRLKMQLIPGLDWLRSHFRGGLTFATDFAVTAGLTQFVVLFVSAVSGTAAAGALKAAQTLVTPAALVQKGAAGPLATVLVRRVAEGARTAAARLSITFSGLCLLGALACVTWLFVPDYLLTALLGDSVVPAKAVLVPTALAFGATGIASGAGYFLRANGELRVATVLKLVCFPVSLVAVIGGAVTWGAAGAQLGLMTGELTRSILAWSAVKRRFRRRR